MVKCAVMEEEFVHRVAIEKMHPSNMIIRQFNDAVQSIDLVEKKNSGLMTPQAGKGFHRLSSLRTEGKATIESRHTRKEMKVNMLVLEADTDLHVLLLDPGVLEDPKLRCRLSNAFWGMPLRRTRRLMPSSVAHVLHKAVSLRIWTCHGTRESFCAQPALRNALYRGCDMLSTDQPIQHPIIGKRCTSVVLSRNPLKVILAPVVCNRDCPIATMSFAGLEMVEKRGAPQVDGVEVDFFLELDMMEERIVEGLCAIYLM